MKTERCELVLVVVGEINGAENKTELKMQSWDSGHNHNQKQT